MTTTVGYYLIHVLPFVFVIAGICFLVGAAIGWMLWGRLRERTYRVENQNDVLRGEIRRLQLSD